MRRAASWCAAARNRALPSSNAAKTTPGCCRAASSSVTKIPPPARAAKPLRKPAIAWKVHEFLGAITYRARGRPKVVQFWRMQAYQRPSRDIMKDIVAVEWLTLAAAVRRLSYPLEKLFLRNIGRRILKRRRRKPARRRGGAKRKTAAHRKVAKRRTRRRHQW